jgi:hypothetical protein
MDCPSLIFQRYNSTQFQVWGSTVLQFSHLLLRFTVKSTSGSGTTSPRTRCFNASNSNPNSVLLEAPLIRVSATLLHNSTETLHLFLNVINNSMRCAGTLFDDMEQSTLMFRYFETPSPGLVGRSLNFGMELDKSCCFNPTSVPVVFAFLGISCNCGNVLSAVIFFP